jgi:uncharacterized protein
MGAGMRWTWDRRKDAANGRKHGIFFDLAVLVFDDPLQASRPDPTQHEERYQTIGMVEDVCLLVAHTYRRDEETGDEHGRIISARKASKQERKRYEEGTF